MRGGSRCLTHLVKRYMACWQSCYRYLNFLVILLLIYKLFLYNYLLKFQWMGGKNTNNQIRNYLYFFVLRTNPSSKKEEQRQFISEWLVLWGRVPECWLVSPAHCEQTCPLVADGVGWCLMVIWTSSNPGNNSMVKFLLQLSANSMGHNSYPGLLQVPPWECV